MARADALKKSEEEHGVTIRAPRGNRTQWHANFKLDEFTPTARDITILQKDEAGGLRRRGMLVIGPGACERQVCAVILRRGRDAVYTVRMVLIFASRVCRFVVWQAIRLLISARCCKRSFRSGRHQTTGGH